MSILKKIIFILTIIWTFESHGQNDTKYSIFWNNLSIYNPAATGGIRNQMGSQNISMNGQTPTFGIDSIHSNSFCVLYEINLDSSKNSLGLNYQQDKIGIRTNNQINLNYSHLFITATGKLNAGIALGYASNNNTLNLNGGLLYTTRRIRTGFGVTHINQSDTQPVKYSFNKTHNYYFNFQYSFVPSPNIKLTPMILVRSIVSSTVADLNLLIEFYRKKHNNLLAGIGYRTSNSIILSTGFTIRHIVTIFYSFNYAELTPNTLYKNNHEIALNIYLKSLN